MAQNRNQPPAPASQPWWSSTALLLGLIPVMAALMVNAAFVAHAAYVLGIGAPLAILVLIPLLARTTHEIATTAPIRSDGNER